MTSTPYKITVIIPHYNSAGKLSRLIDSIPPREDVQIVVVDDNSPAEVVQDIRDHPNLMTRAQVIFSDEKLTAGGARNAGLEIAEGTWLLFADADDFFAPDAFDILDIQTDSYGETVDVFYFKVKGFRENGSGPSERGMRVNRILDNFNEFSRFDHVVPWGKLVKHQLIKDNQIKFEEVRFSNDLMYSAKLAFASDAVRVVDQVLYNLEESSSGLTSRKNEDSSFLRREVQLRHETFLFERLPQEFVANHRNVYYRKYLRDGYKFRSQRLRDLRKKYETAAGISPLNLFRLRYFAYHWLRRLGLPNKLIGSGPGAPYWSKR